ncbi:MAG: hypothetical protein GY788_01765 [bacterium]|nr:hypothetical protein [bacterium]
MAAVRWKQAFFLFAAFVIGAISLGWGASIVDDAARCTGQSGLDPAASAEGSSEREGFGPAVDGNALADDEACSRHTFVAQTAMGAGSALVGVALIGGLYEVWVKRDTEREIDRIVRNAATQQAPVIARQLADLSLRRALETGSLAVILDEEANGDDIHELVQRVLTGTSWARYEQEVVLTGLSDKSEYILGYVTMTAWLPGPCSQIRVEVVGENSRTDPAPEEVFLYRWAHKSSDLDHNPTEWHDLYQLNSVRLGGHELDPGEAPQTVGQDLLWTIQIPRSGTSGGGQQIELTLQVAIPVDPPSLHLEPSVWLRGATFSIDWSEADGLINKVEPVRMLIATAPFETTSTERRVEISTSGDVLPVGGIGFVLFADSLKGQERL